MLKGRETELEEVSKQIEIGSRISLEPGRLSRWARLIDSAEMSLYWLIPAVTLAYFVVRTIQMLSS